MLRAGTALAGESVACRSGPKRGTPGQVMLQYGGRGGLIEFEGLLLASGLPSGGMYTKGDPPKEDEPAI